MTTQNLRNIKLPKLKIHTQISISLILGIFFGIFFGNFHGSIYLFDGFIDVKFHIKAEYFSWLGDLFLRCLNFVTIPLLIISVISGFANIENGKNLIRLISKTSFFYFLTTFFAILIAIFFSKLFVSGENIDLRLTVSVEGLETAMESFGEIVLQLVPTNIFSAFMKGQLASILVLGILFGFFIGKVSVSSQLFLTEFFNSCFEVMMKLTLFILKLTPIGIFGIAVHITATEVIENQRFISIFPMMSKFFLLVLGCLFFHGIIILPIFLKSKKINVWKHFKQMRSSLLMAFSTASSTATLPLTIESLQSGCGVSNRISSFVLPLGATFNINATVIYGCAATIFVTQIYGNHLSFFDYIIMILTSIIASMGAAGIPMSSMVVLSIILTSVGLSKEAVGLLWIIDPILEMFKTVTNVWSDSCIAVVVAKSEGEILNV